MDTLNVTVKKHLKDEPESRKATFPFSFPTSVAEATQEYGEDTTLKLIHEAITLDVQAPARKVLESSEAGLTEEEYSRIVGEKMSTWKIEMKRTRGASGPRVSALQTILNGLSNPETAPALIEKFRSLGIELNMNGELEAANAASGAPGRRVR
jgi:hypothetical protein